MVVLVWWLIWKERNARVFDAGHSAMNPGQLFSFIGDEGSQWVAAGFRALRDLLS
jgi:hypothetical protein